MKSIVFKKKNILPAVISVGFVISLLFAAAAEARHCYLHKRTYTASDGCKIYELQIRYQRPTPRISLPWYRDGAWYNVSYSRCVSEAARRIAAHARYHSGRYACWRAYSNGSLVAYKSKKTYK